MEHITVPLDQFAAHFSTAIELSSVALGGSIVAVSDEFFAQAFHLLLVEPAPSLKGHFGPKGALFSGWETRRHNPTYDWCIIKLGTAGSVFGFDIDTAHFNGNEAPQVSVDALYRPEGLPAPSENDSAWTEILRKVDLGPNSRHLFKIQPTLRVNYVKLNMYPDGGIARFRVYGLVTPVFPSGAFDLAHVFSGGRVVFTSDQHFGVGSNLILPGRGKDMGDGWETKRSRQKGHREWTIIKLGDAGYISTAEIDTAHFKGNFPESCELHAVRSDELIPNDVTEDQWTLILPRTKLGPHRQHYFQLQNVDGVAYTHVRLTIYPDGGIKRVRIIGRRARSSHDIRDAAAIVGDSTAMPKSVSAEATDQQRPRHIIPALPLTPEAFAPFGQVIQAYADGTAVKFHKLALLESSYPPEAGATTGLSVYRCQPVDIKTNGQWPVKLLERHSYTNQAFIPMGSGDELKNPGQAYLVIVAKNRQDDKPDLQSMRAFIASFGQGIVYNTGIWHHPMTVIDRPMDFTCVETQVGNGDKLDCEIVPFDESSVLYEVQLPEM